jgi:uncharacterized membrane protein
LRALEILLMCAVLGVPLQLLFSHVAPGPVSVPVLGFAALVVVASWYLATGRPMAEFRWAIIGVFAIACVGAVAVRFRQRRTHDRIRWRALILVGVGLVLVLGAYLRPFLLDPELVFWHYAGSDGYEYMQVADYLAQSGANPPPVNAARDAALGFTEVVVRDLRRPDGAAEKPGTFALFAGLSAVIGKLPHETYSPLTLAALALLYIALVAYARGLGLSVVGACAFGVFGALAPAMFMLATNTFLANTLALPLLPTFVLLWRSNPPCTIAAVAGVVLGATILLFPDATLLVVGMSAIVVAQAALRNSMRATAVPLFTTSAVAIASVAPFALQLLATSLRRFGSTVASPSITRLKPLTSIDWIWPAFNLNVLPPQPLAFGEVAFLVLFVTLATTGAVLALRHRRAPGLVAVLGGLVVLLVGGMLGGFSSDYDLFRALAVYAFVPLAAIFVVLEWSLAARNNKRAWVVLAGCTVLLAHFGFVDRFHFGQAFAEHLPDAQYTQVDIADRSSVAQLGATQSVVIGTDTPTFTALVNVLMLFSPARPAVPNALYRFVYFGSVPPVDEQYASDLVIENRRYRDVAPAGQAVFESADFRVVANDLVPFFDQDSFPMRTPLPFAFIETHALGLGRVLSSSTDVPFFSREDRDVRLTLVLTDDSPTRQVTVALDHAAAVAFDPASPSNIWHVSQGLHRVRLSSIGDVARVQSFELAVVK